MKIGILTLYDQAFEDIAQRTLPNKQWYADRQGYPLIVERGLIDSSRNGSWNKIPAIKKHLARFDWLFWMHIDSLIANPELRLETLIDLTKNIVFPTDSGREGGFPGNAPGEPRINASHFLIRNCPWAETFLDVAYRQVQFLDHKWWEQKAMMHVLETQPEQQGKVRTLPDRVMKSNPANYEPGDFIVHFGGRDKVARIDAFLSSESVSLRDGSDATSVQRAIRAELNDGYFIYRRVGQSAYPKADKRDWSNFRIACRSLRRVTRRARSTVSTSTLSAGRRSRGLRRVSLGFRFSGGSQGPQGQPWFSVFEPVLGRRRDL